MWFWLGVPVGLFCFIGLVGLALCYVISRFLWVFGCCRYSRFGLHGFGASFAGVGFNFDLVGLGFSVAAFLVWLCGLGYVLHFGCFDLFRLGLDSGLFALVWGV